MSARTVMVTGAEGFVGRNVSLRLSERQHRVLPITRASTPSALADAVGEADTIIHLAGANRPADPADFMAVNRGSVEALVAAIKQTDRSPTIILASSTRAEASDDYGRSKLAGEQVLLDLAATSRTTPHVFRLPNVFGKWSRPDYNSAVATFCYRAARNLPIEVHDPATPLTLVYIDDVVDAFLAIVEGAATAGQHEVRPAYKTTVGEVAETILGFARLRETSNIGPVGTGLSRALYATYVSHLPVECFSYGIKTHRDPRGSFAEMLRTVDSGQFSVFNALPGVTRGGHYHHTKTEKFLVVHGRARFRFRHMVTGEEYALETSGDAFEVVETVPGWAHDVTNIGGDTMVSLLWANEIFDSDRPDTFTAALAE